MPCNARDGAILILFSTIEKRKASANAAAGCLAQTRQKPRPDKNHFSVTRLPFLRLGHFILCETSERCLSVTEYYVHRAGHAGYKQFFF